MDPVKKVIPNWKNVKSMFGNSSIQEVASNTNEEKQYMNEKIPLFPLIKRDTP